MSKSQVFTVQIDGASRGNPGPAAYAYVISRDGHPVVEDAGCLADTTNNIAEYTALLRALERAFELGAQSLSIRSDSELLVKQMNGSYRVKNEQLKELHGRARQLTERFQSVTIKHIPRTENSRADRLCNDVLDGPGRHVPGPGGAGANQREGVHDAAVSCLAAAARCWTQGDPQAPTPEQVWEQLWSILDENGALRRSRSR
jgi:ribonuclease HI